MAPRPGNGAARVLPFPGGGKGAGKPEQASFPEPSSILVLGRETGIADTAAESEIDDDGGLSGEKLMRKFLAWEQAKGGERAEAATALRYYHGKQWTSDQIAVLRGRRQHPTYYNRIRRKVNFLVGTEQRLRRDPKAFPRHPDRDEDATIATHCLRFANERARAEANVSAAVLDYFISGIAVLYQGVITTRGATDPTKVHTPSNRFFYDPRSERHDFSDAKFLGLWQWVEVDTAAEMMLSLGEREAAETVRQLANYHAEGYAGYPAEWAKSKNWVDTSTESVKLIEMYYRWRGEWRLAFLVGQIKLYDRPSIYRNEDGSSRHAFNATSCNIDEEGDRYGIVRDMIPVQDQINHRLSKLLHLLSTRQLIYEKGALINPEKAHAEFMRADGRIELAPGALADKRFLIEQASTEIKGQAELLQSAIGEIENIGPNPGLVGRGEGINKQSGRAILAQQNAGMTELSPEFDRVRELKLKGYEIDWASIRLFWTAERFVRISGRDKSVKFVGINRTIVDPLTGLSRVENNVSQLDVDIVVDEGPDTIVVTEELMQTFAALGEAAVGPLGKILIELSNVPDKDRLVSLIDKMTAPPPEMQAMQAQVAALEAALKEADVSLKSAQADLAGAGVAKVHAETENKRADTLVKMFGIMAPPETLEGSFPRPFADQPGASGPSPSPSPGGMPNSGALPPNAGRPPGGGSTFGVDPLGGPPGGDPGANGFLPDEAPPGPLVPPPVAVPGTDPALGQPGTLPMPPPGVLPAQSAGVSGF